MYHVKVLVIYVTMIQQFVQHVYQHHQRQFTLNLDALMAVHVLWEISSTFKTVHAMRVQLNVHLVLHSVHVQHVIQHLLFIKTVVSQTVQTRLINPNGFASHVQDALHVMEDLNYVHLAFPVSFYTMEFVTLNVLMELSKIQLQKLVNSAHQIVPLVETQHFVLLVSQIFIFIWENVQLHVLFLLFQLYQTQ